MTEKNPKHMNQKLWPSCSKRNDSPSTQLQNAKPGDVIEMNTEELCNYAPPWDSLRLGADIETIQRYQEIPVKERPFIELAYCPGDPEIHFKVIDGNLLLEAASCNGEKTVKCKLTAVRDEKEAYILAVERNCRHGKQLDQDELAVIVSELKKLGFTQMKIAKILGTSQSSISRLIASQSNEQRRPSSGASSGASSAASKKTEPAKRMLPVFNGAQQTIILRPIERGIFLRKIAGIASSANSDQSEDWICNAVKKLMALIAELQDPSPNDNPEDDSDVIV